MELNDKILKAIQEDLPQATAGELKKFIEEANADKVRLAQIEISLQNKIVDFENLKKQSDEFKSAGSLKLEAENKLKEAQKLSDKLKFDIQSEQIKQREFVINKFEGFLNNLVKNPRAIEMISEFQSIPVFQPYAGGGGNYSTQQGYSNSTVTKEETKD